MKIYPYIFSKSFKVFSSYLGCWSILSWLLYMVWGGDPNSFICKWISSCPSTVCWRDYFFPTLNDLGILFEKKLAINEWVYFWAINSIPLVYMSVPHCFYCCSFVVSFESGKCESFNFVIFKDYFGYLETLAILHDFKDLLFHFWKK